MSPESPYDRLPCRGCTADCVNYEHCEGLPWRLGLAQAVAKDQQDDGGADQAQVPGPDTPE